MPNRNSYLCAEIDKLTKIMEQEAVILGKQKDALKRLTLNLEKRENMVENIHWHIKELDKKIKIKETK